MYVVRTNKVILHRGREQERFFPIYKLKLIFSARDFHEMGEKIYIKARGLYLNKKNVKKKKKKNVRM
jgi:hypothetical protein